MSSAVKIVAVADTHGTRPRLPAGDMLVHAGDLTSLGKCTQVEATLEWIASQPHEHKVVIAGNHDIWCERDPAAMRLLCAELGIKYLCDSGMEIAGLRIWGSPYTPKFGDWAFHHDRGSYAARSRWGCIPPDLDLLITHGPPFGIGDRVPSFAPTRVVGDVDLLIALTEMRSPPRYHMFGHIHSDPGAWQTDDLRTRFHNVTTDYGSHPATVLIVLEGR